MDGLILANFGGPRTSEEIPEFLKTLLCDQDVVRTGFPKIFHNFLFSKIAKKRSHAVAEDYAEIGGASPIYEDTENLKKYLEKEFNIPVFTFHRYLPKTHAAFIKDVENFKKSHLLAFPLFPQFSFATTGSCARFFEDNLCGRTLEKLEWISSYENHPAFINAYKENVKKALEQNDMNEEDVCFFYSFHGVPRKFICFNDPYKKHCQASFAALRKHFPKADHLMAFQSKFGKGEWLKPYTIDLVTGDLSWLKKKCVLFIPLSFTSDHIETLFEIEKQYIEPLREKGIKAFRVDALQNTFEWAKEILLDHMPRSANCMLVRREMKSCCSSSHDCCLCKKKILQEDLLHQEEQKNCGNGACGQCHNP